MVADPQSDKPGKPDKADLKTYAVAFRCQELGVEITVDGKSAGRTPGVRVEGLSFDMPHKVLARKEGFKAYSLDLVNPQRVALLESSIEMLRDSKLPVGEQEPKPKPEAKAEPTGKPEPKAVPVARAEAKPKAEGPEPAAKAEPKQAAGRGKGKLACASRPAGAEVWIDGKNSGKKTPVAISSAVELAAGKHKVIFKLNGKASLPQEITIDADQVYVLKGIEIPGA